MGAVAVISMSAGMMTGAQIRAAEAQERRDAVAEAEVQAREEAEARASREAERVALVRSVLMWVRQVQAAETALATANAALAESEGKVTDDAVRQVLATLVDEVRAVVETPPDEPNGVDVASLAVIVADLAVATVVLTDAQTAWLAGQEAAAAAAAAGAAADRARPRGGAGPECGGSSSQSFGGQGFHTSTPTESGDGSNGNLPRSAMTALTWCADSLGNQQWLRTDAAEAMTRLNQAFRAQFGENIAIELSYRSYADQVAARQLYGSGAATPGTSNHGWGTAIDVWEWADYSFGTPRYDWLVTNGPAYGWVSPGSVRQGGSNPEYWHYEYVG
jgi:D-alanyl-D-alanine carboxypeptidase